MRQADVYLLRARIVSDFYPRDVDQFLEGDLEVEVGIEEFEDRDDIFFGDVVLGLHAIEVIREFFESGNAVFVGIVSGLPEGKQVAHRYLGVGEMDETQSKEEYCYFHLYYMAAIKHSRMIYH